MLNKPAEYLIDFNEARWLEVPAEKANKLSHISKINGVFFQPNEKNEELFGYYKVISEDKVLFIKIMALQSTSTHVMAEKIAKHLVKSGIKTICCLPSFPIIDNEHNLIILGYPFISSCNLETDAVTMGLVGTALGKLHLSLSQFTDLITVKQNSKRHLEFCLSNKNKLYSELANKHINAAKIEETIETLMVNEFISNPQVIHGDLNYGNILVSNPSKEVTFVDFEEATRSFFNPMIDVAMTIERFIRTQKSKQDEAFLEFKKNYINMTGDWFKTSAQLPNILRSLSARALLLLASITPENSSDWQIKERSKFLKLHQNAIENSGRLSLWSRFEDTV